jgi:hypothetical protein
MNLKRSQAAAGPTSKLPGLAGFRILEWQQSFVHLQLKSYMELRKSASIQVLQIMLNIMVIF